MDGIFLAHLACTLMMTGLIWVIQVVHYPLFAAVGPEYFAGYELDHTRRITWLVAPWMGLELLTGIVLVARPVTWLPVPWAWAGLLLIALAWSSTICLQVPQHAALQRGFDRTRHRRLLQTNWIRTLAWTGRSGLLLAALARHGN